MKWGQVWFGRMYGPSRRTSMTYHTAEVTGRGLLVLLWNVAAAAAAFLAVKRSLRRE